MIRPELKIFISYAHVDQQYFDIFHEKLKNLSEKSKKFRWKIWTDEEIVAGDRWFDIIKKAVHSSDCAILLSSPGFKKSRFIKKNELKEFLRREENEGIRIIPIFLTESDVKLIPELKEFQFFKEKGKDYGRPGLGDDFINFSEIVKSNKSFLDTNIYINKYINRLIDDIEKPLNPFSIWAKRSAGFLKSNIAIIAPFLLGLVFFSWFYFSPTTINGFVTSDGKPVDGKIYLHDSEDNFENNSSEIQKGKFTFKLKKGLVNSSNRNIYFDIKANGQEVSICKINIKRDIQIELLGNDCFRKNPLSKTNQQ